MTDEANLSRRGFLKGSALVVAFGLASSSTARVAMAQNELPGSLEDYPELDSWIAITEEGAVTVYTGKVELGQGVKTALIQIAADELDVTMGRIDLVTAETETTPDEGYTAGSQSMEDSGTAITYAAADARRILVEAAADELDAEPEDLAVEDGTVSDDAGNETTYWDVVAGASFATEVSADTTPKPPDQQDVVGTDVRRVDVPGKITGEPSYVQDLRRPGMVHGRVVRPPGYAAELQSVDVEGALEVPGVIEVVRDGSFLGVVAETEWQAIRAMNALRESAEWNVEESLPEQGNLYQHLQEVESDDTVAREDGDVDGAIENAAQSLEAEYRRPYQMHASIGPSCAVAEMVSDAQERELRVWTHSQGVYPLREALEQLMADRDVDEIRCTHVEGSGCYGHNGADDVAGDAALLTDAVDGRPVRVQWTRPQEHRWEPYGSAMLSRARAGLSDDGTIVGWDYDVWSYTHSTRPPGQPLLPSRYLGEERGVPIAPEPTSPIPLPTGGGTRNSIPLYEFESRRITHHFLPRPDVRVSALRALGGYANVFALESFVDELAAAAGADPVQFRLDHLGDERGGDVIRRAAEDANWGERDPAENQGTGIGFAQYKNLSAYTAVVVDVTVDPDSGAVTVDRAWAADDSGEVVNPFGVRQQIRGGIVQSVSWTLFEEVDFDARGITDADWSDYPILTFPDLPDVQVSVIDRPGEPYLGTGEAAQGPTAAAIANAVYDAVGARVRELPITPERVTAAME